MTTPQPVSMVITPEVINQITAKLKEYQEKPAPYAQALNLKECQTLFKMGFITVLTSQSKPTNSETQIIS